MGLGLLLLASVGNENNIVNMNPSITFFKKVYKNISYISNEYLPQYFKSTPNFGTKQTIIISNNGDMIKEMVLYFELPEISKSNHSYLPCGIKKFRWVNKIGLALIKYVDLEIGGKLISRHYNDWLNIYDEINPYDNSNIQEDTNIYQNGYHNIKLYIPLHFFFNDISLALPLLALSKQEIKIHVELNDFSSCYKESPSHFYVIDSNICLYKENEIIRQNVDGINSSGRFIYFDIFTRRVYYDMIYSNFIVGIIDYRNKYIIVGDISGFITIPRVNSIICKDEKYFNYINPIIKEGYLLANYIYLDSDTRWFFLNNYLEYVVPVVSNVAMKEVTSINNNYKLQLINCSQILIWRAQLNSNIINNDHFNYSSYPITLFEEPLIQSNKLVINSINRTEIYNNEYYTYLQNYLNGFTSNNNIYMYSFGLNPLLDTSKGSLNFSMMDDAFIQLHLNKMVNYINSVNIKAYNVYFNIFIINNGNGSMKYDL